jgi:hypothetical protein
MTAVKHPITPGRPLLRCQRTPGALGNPALREADRDDLVGRLMAARRAVRDAKQGADLKAEAAAHKR